jgi:hypothetical protein
LNASFAIVNFAIVNFAIVNGVGLLVLLFCSSHRDSGHFDGRHVDGSLGGAE